jgi:hypothetical protein
MKERGIKIKKKRFCKFRFKILKILKILERTGGGGSRTRKTVKNDQHDGIHQCSWESLPINNLDAIFILSYSAWRINQENDPNQ